MSNIMGFGIDPDDFELVLVVLKDRRLSGGCAERGLEHTKNNPKGVIHQSRAAESFFFCKRIPVMMSVRSWLR